MKNSFFPQTNTVLMLLQCVLILESQMQVIQGLQETSKVYNRKYPGVFCSNVVDLIKLCPLKFLNDSISYARELHDLSIYSNITKIKIKIMKISIPI